MTSDAEIEARLRAAPASAWEDLWAAADAVAAEDEHVAWGGGERVGDAVQLPYGVYSEAVRRLLSCLGAVGLVVVFDWPAWVAAHPDRDVDDRPVADAARLVTAICRAERVCEGTVAAALADGTLPAALRRLRRWYNAER
jgi:hypothetical protein